MTYQEAAANFRQAVANRETNKYEKCLDDIAKVAGHKKACMYWAVAKSIINIKEAPHNG